MSSETQNIKVPRLGKNRHGVFFVRASKLDDSGRRRVYQISLGTKDPQFARVLALRFCLNLAEKTAMADPRKFLGRYDIDFATGKMSSDGTKEDHDRMMEAMQAMAEAQMRIASVQRSAPPQMPVAALVSQQASATNQPPPSAQSAALYKLKAALDAHHANEVASKLAIRTLGEKRVLFDEFLDCFGDVPLSTITTQEITAQWRPLEQTRPNKKYEGQTLSLGRQEKRRTYLSKFFKWAMEGKFYPYEETPVGMKMASKSTIKSVTKSYVEFNSDDLAKLFNASYKQNMDKPDFYWLPLMALFSGARLGEISNIKLEDIEIVEGIHVYEVTAGKTDGSLRTVPIHSQLLALGFWDYVQSLKAKNKTHLISFRPVETLGKRAGDTWSQWVKDCGIKNQRKRFHSFRSTVITDMHNANAGEAATRSAVGHVATEQADAHTSYIRGIKLIKIKEAIEKLSFPTIDFTAIKRADPTFSEYIDAEIAAENDPVQAAKAAKIKANRMKRAEMDKRLGSSRKPRTETAKPITSTIFRKRKPKKVVL